MQDVLKTKYVVKGLPVTVVVLLVLGIVGGGIIALQPASLANFSANSAAASSSVTYEATAAYVSGGASIEKATGSNGTGYVDHYTNVGAETIFSVQVPLAGTYAVTLRYANAASVTRTLNIYANGIKLQQTALSATGGWNTWSNQTENLSLRAGLNTLSYKYDQNTSGHVDLASISVAAVQQASLSGAASLLGVQNALASEQAGGVSASTLAARGATLPYVEQEAEDAATNGTIIGPDYTYTHLASEASGRKAVQLTGSGKYVEFTLTQPANAMTVRYSVPDTSDGSGLTAPLSLYLNGNQQPDLTLTSKYSWFYGSYPFTNNPGDGTPHHFYDETRVMFGSTLPKGAKVRLQVDSGDTSPWYIIDLADFYDVGAAYTEPAGYLSVTAYGADATGRQDSTQAVQNAVNAAESQGKGLWIPQGTFQVNGHIIVDNVTIRGAGPWYSILQGNGVGIYGNYAPNPSKNVQLYDFAIFGQVMNRDDGAAVNGIGGSLGGGSIIQDIWIEHTKVGMWFDGPFSDLLITGDTIRDTTADGINFHDGITNATVEQTEIRNTGDDGLAMWSQTNPDKNDVFQFNTVQMPILANNIAIYGGSDNSITDNMVYDTLVEGGGIHVGNRFSAVPLAGTTTIARNTMIRAGQLDPNWQFGVGALWFYALDEAMNGTINVTDNEIDDSPEEAIQFIGSNVTNVTVNGMTINGTGTFAVQLQAAGSATFSNVVAKNLGSTGQYNCGVGFTITQGTGNSGWSTTQCGFPSVVTPPSQPITPVAVTTSGATPTTAAVSVPTPTALPAPTGTLVTAISAGGTGSGKFVADTDYNQGNEYTDNSAQINTSGVSSPAPQEVYQSCRWFSSFTYTIPGLVAGNSYLVQLDWAELTFQAAGLRQFNVAINGQSELTNFDVFANAGYKKALIRQFTVKASSAGNIVIAFTQGSADNPFINGIEVWQPTGSTSSTPTTTPTAQPKTTPTVAPTPTPVSVPVNSLTTIKSINAGGGAAGGFVADTNYDQGNEYSDTTTSIDVSHVTNPAAQSVYQSCRWNASFTYTIPGLKAGNSYIVQLDWAELTFQQSGQRQFNVAINGDQVLYNFDVYATAGYKKALQLQYVAVANSKGQIVLSFTRGAADNPFINAIQVFRLNTGNPSLIGTTPTLVKAINAGGTGSGNYAADTDYYQGNEFSDTTSSIDTSGVAQPAAQAVYQTCRWNSSFTYTIPGLNAGKVYTVQLDWAEMTFHAAGQREFNLAINGNQVLNNFDVAGTAGYKRALVMRFTAVANSNGQIVLSFTKGAADNPFVNAIEIYTAS